MSSPATGLQQRARRTRQLSMSLTTIPLLDAWRLAGSAWTVLLSSLYTASRFFFASRVLFSFVHSSRSLKTTFCAVSPPYPTLAYRSSILWKPYLLKRIAIHSCLKSCSWVLPIRLNSRSISSLPCSIFSSRLSRLNHWLILFFAWVLLTTLSQSRLGPREFCEVMISMRSPFWIL